MQSDKMSDVREQLISAKKKLVATLGENEKAYWANMKSWFKHRITKEEFDSEARKLLPKDSSHLHNLFLLAVLTKCHMPSLSTVSKEASTSQSSIKMKKTKRLQAIKRKYDHRFSVNQAHADPPCAVSSAQQSQLPQPVKMCAKSLLMPSADEMRNYVAIIAWELGLDDISDDVIALATSAVRVFLKNLLTAIFSRRSAYKTVNSNFKYAMGCEPENPYLTMKRSSFYATSNTTSSTKLSFHVREQNEVEDKGREALESVGSNKTPVNMYDLQHALQVFGQSLIPSHSVYALASERIVASLWHPDHEEIKQDRIMKELTIIT